MSVETRLQHRAEECARKVIEFLELSINEVDKGAIVAIIKTDMFAYCSKTSELLRTYEDMQLDREVNDE